jgi:hypothetical protein
MILKRNKIFSFIFLSITAIPLLCCIYLFTKQQIVHLRMAEALEEKALHTIVVKSSDAKWISLGNEILISGHLFDVESYKESGDNLYLTGLYDTEEDHLNHQLKKIEQAKSNGNTFENTLIISLLSQTFFSESSSGCNKNIFHKSVNRIQLLFDEILYSTFLDIIIPPPKTATVYIVTN